MNRAEQIHYNETLISMGLGDTVSKLITKATLGKVKPCNSCEERKKKLNNLFPYKNKSCPKCEKK